MAYTWTETNNLSLSEVEHAIEEMESFINKQEDELVWQNAVISAYTDVLYRTCPIAVATLNLLFYQYQQSCQQVIANAEAFLDELYKMRETLKEPYYDLIKVEVEMQSWRLENDYYDIPYKCQVIALHRVEGGWV
ncbi:MAG: hypothetical protein H0Z40_12035 [Desulfotomaculum sp.]|nr:hypothetical protein [Desulfotomaculum sp.]